MPRPVIYLFCLGFFLVSSLTYGGRKDRVAPVPANPYDNSHFLRVDSVLLHYRTWNDDLPGPRGKIVLIHGFCGSTHCWRKNIEPLVAAGFRVVAVDLPSFGYSERNPSLNQSNSSRALLVWHLLDAIDGKDTTPWNVAGHSMGGGVAEAMALVEPTRTQTLTVVDGLVFMKSSNLTNTASAAAKNRLVNRFLVNMTENNVFTYKTLRRLLKSAYGRQPDSVEVMGYLTPLLIDGTAQAAFGVWTHSREVVSMDVKTMPTIPLLIIWGGKDNWIGKGKGRRLQKAVPGSDMEIIPGAGHIPIETHPDEFNAIFVPWLLLNNPSSP